MVDIKSKSSNDASDHIMLLNSSKTNNDGDDDEADSFNDDEDDDDDEDIIYNASNSIKRSNNKNNNKKRLINLSATKLNKKLASVEKKVDESIPISLFKYILMNFSFVLNVILNHFFIFYIYQIKLFIEI
jgi:hypothetical protein